MPKQFCSILILGLIFLQSKTPIYSQTTSSDSIAYELLLEDYIVTGQYEPTHYKKSFFPVDVIQRQELQQLGAIQLDDALSMSSTIRLTRDAILGTQITMRGISSSNVAILIDGVPIIGRLDGAIDISQIPLHNIERIEIVDGPMSNVYGNNAAAGVINLITKKSQINDFNISTKHQIESQGNRDHQLQVGYQLNKILVRLHGRYFEYDKYDVDSLRVLDEKELVDGSILSQSRYPWNPKEQYGTGGLVKYSINNDHSIGARFDYNFEEVSDYGSVKRPAFKPYANDAFYSTTRRDAAIFYKGEIKGILFDYNFGINEYIRNTDERRYYLESMTFDSTLGEFNTTSFKGYFSRLNLARKFNNKLELLGGFHYDIEQASGDRIVDRNQSDTTTSEYREWAVYSDLRYSPLESMRLSGSLRYTNHSIYGPQWTPAFMAQYDIHSTWTIRGGVSTGYRSPSLKELNIEFIDVNHFIVGNQDLNAEQSNTIQASISHNISKSFEARLDGYYTSVNDQIILVEYEPLKYTYENLDEYSVKGLILAAQFKQNQFSLESSLGLSYWKTSLDAPSTPEFRQTFDMNHQCAYAFEKHGISLISNYRMVGSQPNYQLLDEEVVTQNSEAYHMLDFSIQKSFWKNRISIIGGVRNAMDVRRITSTQTGGAGHGSSTDRIIDQGRNYFVSLSFDW